MKMGTRLRSLAGRPIWRRRLSAGLVAFVFAVVLAVAGFASIPPNVAADGPTCDPNDVMPCGASSASEFIGKITGDMSAVYAHFGLSASDYDDFKSKAVAGVAKKDGTVVDDKGNVVMEDAWSIGRTHFEFAEPYGPLDSVGQFFRSAHATTPVLAQDLPVLILFDKEGTVKFAVITSCGNPIQAKKVKSGAECKDLIKEEVKDKKNAYRFTTDAHKFGFAEFLKFDYFFDDGSGKQHIATTERADEPVEKTFDKDAKVWVEITVILPGNNEKVVIDEACATEVKVKKEENKEEKKEEKPVVKVLSVKEEKPAPPAKLPVTGPASLAALFTGVSAAGAIGHHLYISRRKNRK
jgi:hypothetical protein